MARPMTFQDRSAFVSVAEAARRLGVSTAMVKRRIRDGTLEAEPLSRPQGIEYRVRLPRDVTPTLAAPASDVSPPLTERSDSELAALTSSAHVTKQDVSAAITAAIAPLAERLAVQDTTISRQAETIERQADAIAELREDRGRLTPELAAAHERIASLAAPQQPGDVSTAAALPDPFARCPGALVATLARVVGGRPRRRCGRLGELPGVGVDQARRAVHEGTLGHGSDGQGRRSCKRAKRAVLAGREHSRRCRQQDLLSAGAAPAWMDRRSGHGAGRQGRPTMEPLDLHGDRHRDSAVGMVEMSEREGSELAAFVAVVAAVRGVVNMATPPTSLPCSTCCVTKCWCCSSPLEYTADGCLGGLSPGSRPVPRRGLPSSERQQEPRMNDATMSSARWSRSSRPAGGPASARPNGSPSWSERTAGSLPSWQPPRRQCRRWWPLQARNPPSRPRMP